MNAPRLKGLAGLYLTSRRLGLAYRPAAYRLPRRKFIFSRSLEAQQSPAEALAAAVKMHDLQGCFCADALPLSLCRMQVLSLPYLTNGELLRLTRQRAFWQENLHADAHRHGLWWRRLPSRQPHETRLMLAAVPSAALNERVQIIHAAGLQLHRLSLSCFDYCQLSDFSKRFCLLVLDDDEAFCLAAGSHGVEVRHMDQPFEPETLTRCMQWLRRLFAESSLSRLRVVAMQDDKHKLRLDDWRAAFPECMIELHSPLALCRGWASNLAEARAAARMLRRHGCPLFRTPAVNFCVPPQRRLLMRLQWLSALWLASALAVGALPAYWSGLSQQRYAQWKEEDQLYKSALSNGEKIKEQLRAGSERLQRHRVLLSQLEDLRRARRRLPFLLSALEESVPHGVWLNQVNIPDAGRLKIHGTAAADRLVHELVDNLGAYLHPLAVDTESARFSSGEDEALRRFVLTILVESKTDDRVGPAAQAAQQADR